MWIDSHCHLGEIGVRSPARYLSWLEKAKERQIGRFLSVALNEEEYRFLKERRRKGDPLDIAIGIHPFEELCGWRLSQIEEYAGQDDVSAIGEIGLDYSRPVDRKRQRYLFTSQAEIARHHRKPIVVHSRKAEGEMSALLREMDVRAVIHAYPGSRETYHLLSRKDIYFSFGTVLTHENAYKRREAAVAIAPERLLIESDAPYGKSGAHPHEENEPSFLIETAACLAALRGVRLDVLKRELSENYSRFIAKV